ncbi:MAG: hypothetical protein PF441_01845 [Desulfuromusa sp.]|jgi:regulator of protease activity HflC (stomatin/prohibitin superfamily)|nr:hypothetical protein [Desulfuromusa sp.]
MVVIHALFTQQDQGFVLIFHRAPNKKIIVTYARGNSEAKIFLAQATEEATTRINSAIAGGNNTAIMYLLGERYVDAIKEISTSDNSKTILLPADLPAAVRGLMGGLGMK